MRELHWTAETHCIHYWWKRHTRLYTNSSIESERFLHSLSLSVSLSLSSLFFYLILFYCAHFHWTMNEWNRDKSNIW